MIFVSEPLNGTWIQLKIWIENERWKIRQFKRNRTIFRQSGSTDQRKLQRIMNIYRIKINNNNDIRFVHVKMITFTVSHFMWIQTNLCDLRKWNSSIEMFKTMKILLSIIPLKETWIKIYYESFLKIIKTWKED